VLLLLVSGKEVLYSWCVYDSLMYMKTQTMTIQGKDYPYVLCERCGVWIQEEKIDGHVGSPECGKWLKNRAIRERASGRALGVINRV